MRNELTRNKVLAQSVATFAVVMAFVFLALLCSGLLAQGWYGDWRCSFISYSHWRAPVGLVRWPLPGQTLHG